MKCSEIPHCGKRQNVSSVWNFAVDGGTGNPAQGFPFVLYGPTLTSTPLTFPSVCVGSNNIQSTTITGGGLTGTSVVVGPLASFGFSTNPLGPFDPTVTLSYVGSTLSSVVYVQYLPLAAGNNNGSIPMLGGGASGNIAVTANANSAPTVTASSTPSPAIVCSGSNVTLNGAGASTYTWTDGVNTPTDGLAFVPTSSSTYTVTGTDGNGCTATSTIAVTVNALPVVSSTATPSAFCLGGSSTLDAISPSIVLFNENFANNSQGWTLDTEWGIGSATASSGQSTGNPDPATDNTSTADNGVAGVVIGGNATTALHPAYYLTSPVINLAGMSNVNLNFARWLNSDYTPFMQNTIDVYDGSAWVNIWQTGGAPGIFDNAWTLQTFNISAYVNANFQVRFGVAVGNTGAYTISSWNIDDVIISASPSLTWSGPATIANPALASTLVTPITSGAQTYTVTATAGNGCTATSTSVVTVNAIPTVTANSIPSPATVCLGTSLTLNGTGANSYTWTNGVNTPTDGVAFIPTSNSTYTVTGTDGNGCIGTSTLDVIVNGLSFGSSTPVPEVLYYKFDGTGTSVPNLASAPPIGTATATILGGISQGGVGQSGGALVGSGITSTTDYLNTGYAPNLGTGSWTISFWSQGISTNSTLYYIFGDGGTNAFRCFTNGVAGPGNWILRGAGLTDVYINGGAQLTPTLNTFVYDATLNNVKGYLNGVLVSTVAQGTPNLTGTGPLKVMGYNSNIGSPAGGKLDEFRIYNHALTPAEVLSLLNVNPSFSATATPNMACPGSTVSLESTGGSGIVSYSWAPGSLSGNPVNATVASSTVYTVTATDNNGCTGTTTTTVNTYPAVNVSATSTPTPATVCQGSNVTLNGAGALSYTWTDGTNTPADGVAFAPSSSSTYTVTGTDGNGCTGTSSLAVTVNPAPPVTASATPSTTCNNSTVTPMGGGASTYAWSGGLTDNTPFVATTGTTTYTVTGTDGIGCTATSTVSVTVNAASGTLAPSTSNQAQNQADDFNLSYYDPSCNLIATVDDGAGGNILGLTTATVNVDANAGVHNGQPFVRRWYQITPSNNVGVSAIVTLYIDQADFTNYNNAVASPYLPMPTSGNNSDPNITNIRITKNSDAGLGNTPEVITPTTINWNGNYWELTFPVTGFSQFRVHSANPGNTPLPATITKFNGRKLNSSDMLEWTTASEQNNAYFNLQHSTNGVDFKTIAKVNSKAQNGNSQTELNYSYEHTTPSLGHNYYRLEQVDIDNQSTINAKIVDIIWGANGNTVSLYPNPTQDVLNIDLYTSKVQNTTVKVLDMSGRVVKQIQARSAAGMSTLSISLGELASGVYTVQVYDNDKLSHVGKVKKN